MGWLGTLVVGLIAGLVASKIMKTNTGLIVNLALGVAGAFVGGLIAQLLTGVPLSGGINLWNILVSLGGSVLIIWVYRLIKKK